MTGRYHYISNTRMTYVFFLYNVMQKYNNYTIFIVKNNAKTMGTVLQNEVRQEETEDVIKKPPLIDALFYDGKFHFDR